MSIVDRIGRRFAKDEAEREAAYAKGASAREEGYRKIESLLAEYDDLCRRTPYTIPEEARHLWRHILDEHSHDLIWFFQRTREGKTP
jgi:hypothetical protein